MRKTGRIGVLLAGMGIVLGIAMTAEAGEERTGQGTFQFQSMDGNVQIWAADVALLRDKVSGISGEIFNPEYYSQMQAE